MNQRAQSLIRLIARWIVEDRQAGRLPIVSPAVVSRETEKRHPMNENSTAIHEAGHAVASVRLMPSRYTGEVTIIPNHEDNYNGAHAPLEHWNHDEDAAQQ